MNLRDQMDAIYGGAADSIPWNLTEPPQLLVDLVTSGAVAPCDAIDLGCGCGNYAVWLAQQGFRVTGVDLSVGAVRLADALAHRVGVTCRFLVADLLDGVPGLEKSFDFAFDWEVLHHVFPEERERYVAEVARMLRPGGMYLSVSFSEEDPMFGGAGKYRGTPIGTLLYFSSEVELRALFAKYFAIEKIGTVEVGGKHGSHRVVACKMQRKA